MAQALPRMTMLSAHSTLIPASSAIFSKSFTMEELASAARKSFFNVPDWSALLTDLAPTSLLDTASSFKGTEKPSLEKDTGK